MAVRCIRSGARWPGNCWAKRAMRWLRRMISLESALAPKCYVNSLSPPVPLDPHRRMGSVCASAVWQERPASGIIRGQSQLRAELDRSRQSRATYTGCCHYSCIGDRDGRRRWARGGDPLEADLWACRSSPWRPADPEEGFEIVRRRTLRANPISPVCRTRCHCPFFLQSFIVHSGRNFPMSVARPTTSGVSREAIPSIQNSLIACSPIGQALPSFSAHVASCA